MSPRTPFDEAPAQASGLPRLAPSDVIAHDLNNALAIIVNYTTLLDRALEHDTVTTGRLRADLGEISLAARRAIELSRRL